MKEKNILNIDQAEENLSNQLDFFASRLREKGTSRENNKDERDCKILENHAKLIRT